jgi:hypothetical protein
MTFLIERCIARVHLIGDDWAVPPITQTREADWLSGNQREYQARVLKDVTPRRRNSLNRSTLIYCRYKNENNC